MHFKNKTLIENQISNMNKTYKTPSRDDVDGLLLKNAEYERTYGRPRKSSSPQLSPKLSRNKKNYWKSKSALLNSSLRDTFDNLNQDDDNDDDNNDQVLKKSQGNSSKIRERLSQPDSSQIQKTKSEWYNALYPTYKSRLEEFKRTFVSIPDDERLIVDHSCALQKDVVIHGRLYISKNYVCFYAKTYMSETSITLRWIDIVSINKEKSSLIPNAILISTETDKLLFKTFGTTDKTYSMMFKLWKSSLINKPISEEEIWQLIHTCYGDELGLPLDDEDDKNFPSKYLGDSFSEFEASFMAHSRAHSTFSIPNENLNVSLKLNSNVEFAKNKTDLSNTTESDSENGVAETDVYSDCTAQHDGHEVVSKTLPINIDQLFILLFTGSKFFFDFHTSRKTTNLMHSPWIESPETGTKTRNVSMTVSLTQPVGPKTSQITEKQVMLACSSPGSRYCIDIETLNSGIPYAESFSVETHFCMTSVSDCETNIKIYSQVNFKKYIWAMMKSLIMKNCLSGLEEFYGSLIKAVALEYAEIKMKDDEVTESTRGDETYVCNKEMKKISDKVVKKKTSKRSRVGDIFKTSEDSVIIMNWFYFVAIIFLVIINGLLFYKLWGMENVAAHTIMDLHILKNTPKSEEEWINLLQHQESLHTVEMRKWQRVLQTAVQLLKQTEESLTELKKSMHPTATDKMFSVLKPQL